MDVFLRKVTQCTGGEDLECRRFNVVRIIDRFDLLFQFEERLLVYGTAVDGYTVPSINEVWRCELADFFVGGDERGGDVGACGAFAIGAGHVDYFEMVLWITEVF